MEISIAELDRLMNAAKRDERERCINCVREGSKIDMDSDALVKQAIFETNERIDATPAGRGKS